MQRGSKQAAALQAFRVERKSQLVSRQMAPYSTVCCDGGWTTLQRALEKDLQCLSGDVEQGSLEGPRSELQLEGGQVFAG